MALSLIQTPPPSPAIHNWKVTPADYGIIIGDNITDAERIHNAEAMQAAWDYCAANGRSFLHVGGPIEVGNELKTRTGLTYERQGGSSWLKPTWTPGMTIPWLSVNKIGGFITNGFTSADPRTLQQDVLFVDPWVDSTIFNAHNDEYGICQGGTTTSIILAPEASSVDGYYVGKLVSLVSGTGTAVAGLRFILTYNGTTKLATISGSFAAGAPVAGDTMYDVGTNTNGIGMAAGAQNLRVLGGIFKHFHPGLGAGGKGISCQQGSTGTVINGTIFEDCLLGVMQQGWTGTLSLGQGKGNLQDSFTNLIFRNCATAYAAYGNDSADTTSLGSMSTYSAVLSNLTAYECGHSPQRLMTFDTVSTHMKSGVFCFARGHNVSMYNVRVYNSIAPVWPTDHTHRVGYGMVGDLGAVIWINGRQIDIHGVYAEGNFDALVRFGRVRAIGDDGPPVGDASPVNNFKVRISNARLHGSVQKLVELGETLGYYPSDTNLSCDVEAEADGVTTSMIDARFQNYKNSRFDLVLRNEATSSYKRVIGTGDQIVRGGNNFASYPEGISRLEENPAPRHVVGKLYMLWEGMTGSIAPAAINQIYFYPFIVYRALFGDSVVLKVVTGGAASQVKAGIWINDPSTNRPVGAPVGAYNTAGNSTASGANLVLGVDGGVPLSVKLVPGTYWIGTKFTHTAGALPVMQCIAAGSTWVQSWAGVSAPDVYGFTITDTFANAMPTIAAGATFTNVTAGGIPILSLVS